MMQTLTFTFQNSAFAQTPRETVTGWLATLFFVDIPEIGRADVVDYSDSGASLTMAAMSGLIGKGVLLTVSFEAQQRRFSRLAKVRWVQDDAGLTRFGVEFVDHAALDARTHMLDLTSAENLGSGARRSEDF